MYQMNLPIIQPYGVTMANKISNLSFHNMAQMLRYNVKSQKSFQQSRKVVLKWVLQFQRQMMKSKREQSFVSKKHNQEQISILYILIVGQLSMLEEDQAITCKKAKINYGSLTQNDIQLQYLMFGSQLFCIKSKLSGRCLDICQDNSENQGSAILWDYYGGPNQQFIMIQSGQDISFQCKKSNKYLSVASQATQNGVSIIQQAPNGLSSQKFRLHQTSQGSGQYVIYTFCGKTLDCCEEGKYNGTKIIQWDYHGKDNQKWILSHI